MALLAVREPDLCQQRPSALLTLRPRATPEHRHLHVFDGRQRRDQAVELEDEADRRSPVLGRIVDTREQLAADGDRARVRPVEQPDQVEQSALAAAGGTGERDELARSDPERDTVQRADSALVESLDDVLDDDLRTRVHVGVTTYLSTFLDVPTLMVTLNVNG